MKMTRTKILATIGPASEEKIHELAEAGLDGIRINMSHKKQEEFPALSSFIKKIKEEYAKLFFVGDLQGPKIRLGDFESKNIRIGDEIIIAPSNEYSAGEIPIQLNDLYKYVPAKCLLLIDDGNTGLRVKDIKNKKVITNVEYGEILEPRKGVNIPGVSIPMVYLSEKDKRDLEFLVVNGFNYVSASYSRNAEDIKQVRQFAGTGIMIIGKPENHEGTRNLLEIIKYSDAMMVPRGDYGMEMGVENVPSFQKKLIELCNIAGTPVITATQMLESMMNSKEPKRAEVSDVSNAVLDGSDVVMLSGETSKGKYPVETVTMMNKIIRKAEEYLFDKSSGIDLGEKINKLVGHKNVTDLISKAVYSSSMYENISAVIVPTNHGTTARMISRFRLKKPVIAVCHDDFIKRSLNAAWGVIPILTDNKDEKYVIEDSINVAKQKGYIHPGESVIVTAGVGNYEKGGTNLMRIENVA
jgi:pyruvate kinase